MTYSGVPQLTARSVPQTYGPLGGGSMRYRAGDFLAGIRFGQDGIVTHYPGYLERLPPKEPLPRT